jgi:hypothetical protein
MGSLIEGLRREAAAWAEADWLRTRIEELAEDLARAEERVTRLAISQGGLQGARRSAAARARSAGPARPGLDIAAAG